MKFLIIINISPLDSCTYLGLDQGGQPCQVILTLCASVDSTTEKRYTERKHAANCVTPIYSVYLL